MDVSELRNKSEYRPMHSQAFHDATRASIAVGDDTASKIIAYAARRGIGGTR